MSEGGKVCCRETVGRSTTAEMVEEVVREAQSHLSNVHRVITRLGIPQSLTGTAAGTGAGASVTVDPLFQIQKIICQSVADTELKAASSRHAPIIVTGGSGSGKTSLLAQVFTFCTEWLEAFPDTEAVRIVRLCGRSPNCSYATELLRSLCQQICLEFAHLDVQEHLLSDSVIESSLSIRFQELIKISSSRS